MADLPGRGKLDVKMGDITTMDTDAIVNSLTLGWIRRSRGLWIHAIATVPRGRGRSRVCGLPPPARPAPSSRRLSPTSREPHERERC